MAVCSEAYMEVQQQVSRLQTERDELRQQLEQAQKEKAVFQEGLINSKAREGWQERQKWAAEDKLEQAQARVAELEAREDAMCDLSYANGVKHGFSLGQMDDGAGLDKCVSSRMKGGVKDLKRLRQQANELEQK